jgi:hypothetical protein
MIMNKIKSLVWADYFLFALTDPRELYRLINSKKSGRIYAGLAVPAVVVIADILALSLLGEATGFFFYKITYGWILILIYTVVKIAVYASLIDTVSQFMGYEGKALEVTAMVSYSMFPKVFILPIVYFFSIINFAPGFFYVFFIFILFVWYVMILVQGISEMHSIEFSRALALYIIPGLLTGLAFFFMFVLIIISGAGMLFG